MPRAWGIVIERDGMAEPSANNVSTPGQNAVLALALAQRSLTTASVEPPITKFGVAPGTTPGTSTLDQCSPTSFVTKIAGELSRLCTYPTFAFTKSIFGGTKG